MNDTKLKSLSETIVNTGVGYTINYVANALILPHYGIPFDWITYHQIGAIYTVISIARQYLLRRLFNKLKPTENLYSLLKKAFKLEQNA
jgi:hypothetical protein